MIKQSLRRHLVDKPHDQATTYRFAWGSNELSQRAPAGIAPAGGAG